MGLQQPPLISSPAPGAGITWASPVLKSLASHPGPKVLSPPRDPAAWPWAGISKGEDWGGGGSCSPQELVLLRGASG